MREKRDAKGRDYHSKVIRLYEKGVGNSIPTTKIFHKPPFSVWIEEKSYSMKISFHVFFCLVWKGWETIILRVEKKIQGWNIFYILQEGMLNSPPHSLPSSFTLPIRPLSSNLIFFVSLTFLARSLIYICVCSWKIFFIENSFSIHPNRTLIVFRSGEIWVL